MTSDGRTPNLRNALVLVGLLVVLGWMWAPRWRKYPQVTHEEGLRLVRKLYSACNMRDPKLLAAVSQELDAAHRDGRISEGERRSFEAAIADAQAGRWEVAARASMQFAKDQLRWGAE